MSGVEPTYQVIVLPRYPPSLSIKLLKKRNLKLIVLYSHYELSQKFFTDKFQSLETLISGKLVKVSLERLTLPAISVQFGELLMVVGSVNGFEQKVCAPFLSPITA